MISVLIIHNIYILRKFILNLFFTVIDYFFLSKTKYGYNTEQSLGLLFHNNFNLSKAFKDLPNYTRIINWSNFEKHNFEIAFLKFGKNFEQIRKQVI